MAARYEVAGSGGIGPEEAMRRMAFPLTEVGLLGVSRPYSTSIAAHSTSSKPSLISNRPWWTAKTPDSMSNAPRAPSTCVAVVAFSWSTHTQGRWQDTQLTIPPRFRRGSRGSGFVGLASTLVDDDDAIVIKLDVGSLIERTIAGGERGVPWRAPCEVHQLLRLVAADDRTNQLFGPIELECRVFESRGRPIYGLTSLGTPPKAETRR
ncbi:hypothetical protein FB451DRAFT_1169176 [Mycena latifolia]|nr:hypothetical protein FB451DRAFT_1169176 [Mycena latifolia]